MKALSLSGPWAFYERKNAENEARIAQLESEALRSRHDAESLSAQLAEARAEAAALRTDAVPQLQDEAARARELAEQLQAELAAVRGDKATAQRELSEQVQGLSDELQRVTADCAVLRAELAKTVHARTSTASKLDIVRKKLGLTESEAKVFIQVRGAAPVWCGGGGVGVGEHHVTLSSSQQAVHMDTTEQRAGGGGGGGRTGGGSNGR